MAIRKAMRSACRHAARRLASGSIMSKVEVTVGGFTGSATSAAPGSPPAWTGGTCDATNWDATDCVFCLDCFQLCCADEGGYCCGGTGARQLTWCQVPDYVCLANVGPAFGTFDYWLTYTHTSKQLVDVSALTKNGPIVLTIQGTGSGSTYSWPSQINASIDASAQFVMTQTPSDFRPMDARDPAANCPGFSPGSGTSDNCHITYQVELAGPRQGELAGPRTGPMMAAMAPDRKVQRQAQNCASPGRTLSAARFSALPPVAKDHSLSSQVSPFTPGRPFPGAAVQSGARLAGLAGQRPQPKDVPTLAAFTATYHFSLTLPTAAGGPPATWLPGTSTNYTPPNTDLNGPDPDYVLETTTNPSLVVASDGLSAFTPIAVDPTKPTSVVVTSHDFGGVAEFHATATVQAVTPTGTTGPLTVDVTVSNGLWSQDPVPAPSDSPTRLCGTDYAQHPFASLPVDQDCNGIADSWEDQYIALASANSQSCGGPAVTHFTGDEDIEYSMPSPGAPDCASKVGDGYALRDEYRGFHEYNATTNAVIWKDTDPVNVKDLFFYDQSDSFTSSLLRQPADIQDPLIAQLLPFVRLHPLSAELVRFVDPGHIKPNSPNRTAGPVGSDTFPLYLVDAPLGGNCTPPTFSAVLGHAPDGPPANAPDGRPISLDNAMMNACAPAYNYSLGEYRQILITHEIGHNLSLRHPTQNVTYQNVSFVRRDISPLVLLGENRYTYGGSPATEVYTWFMDYMATVNGQMGLQVAEKFAPGLGLFGDNPTVSLATPLTPLFSMVFSDSPFGQRKSVFANKCKTPVTSQALAIRLTCEFTDATHVNLMNWTPRWDFSTLGAYRFKQTDAERLCLSCRPDGEGFCLPCTGN